MNTKGDGKVFVYDGNINYNDAKFASYVYNGTSELIKMEDWNGKTSIGRDVLNRVVKVTDHNGRKVEYSWDKVNIFPFLRIFSYNRYGKKQNAGGQCALL